MEVEPTDDSFLESMDDDDDDDHDDEFYETESNGDSTCSSEE